jgi:hypothetical protein
VAGYAFGKFPVVVEGGFIKFPALRLNPCPCDGKAEELAAKSGGGGDVLLIAIPEICGSSPWGETLALFPKIPDILVEGIVSLDLVVSVRRAEEEVLGEIKFQSSNFKIQISSAVAD